MCGIVGIVYLDNRNVKDNLVLKKMCSVISHRGPDGEGYHIGGNVAFGMKRLSIIDLIGGAQPIYNEDRTIAVVNNGEIYNFKSLRKDLQARGHLFKTSSDTEVIVHAYEEYGDAFILKLNGMFAIALHDSRSNRVLLVRDRLGVKPLHYMNHGDTLLFASEIKSIFEYDVPKEINWRVLDVYLAFGYVPGPESFFKNVYKLPPGHVMEIKDGRADIRKYWDLTFEDDPDLYNEREVAARFLELFQDAVRIRLISDVPLGAFLSGGLDSTAVVALMSSESPEPVNTFTIGFENRQFDERERARKTADKFGTNHSAYVIQPQDCEELLRRIAWYFDEPFADLSAVPTYLVSKIARENITVALSGDGGDEMLAGYTHYQGEKLSSQYTLLPSFFRRTVLPSFALIGKKVLPGDKAYAMNRLHNVLLSANLSFEDRFAYKHQKIDSCSRKSLLSGHNGTYKDAGNYIRELFSKCEGLSNFSKLNYFDIKFNLPDDILVKVDRMSMANSLEVRSPFLDYRIAEFLCRVPPSLKLKLYCRKNILIKSMKKVLPACVSRDGKKRGFIMPLRDWFKEGYDDFARETVFSSSGIIREFMDTSVIEGIFEEHKKGEKDNSDAILVLLNLAIWHETFFKS